MAAHYDLARMTTATTGTGTITLASAAAGGYLTFANAGVVDGQIVRYGIVDGSSRETGYGVYTSSGTTLTRATIVQSTNSDNAIDLSGTAEVFITVGIEDFAPFEPQGRLTLTSATPILTGDVTGAGTIYYALARGSRVPLYDGAYWHPFTFAELSQALSDTTKSPAAAVANACYDLFVWNDAGTLRCTRGPAWVDAKTFTVTIASPAVFTCASHGLAEGQPIVLSTSGALPTGLSAATVYYVINSGFTTGAFQVSATRLGSAINTSGSQSGTHTLTQNMTVRGTGAGTTELTRIGGLFVNANAITNGPAANRGLYVGTIFTNGSGTVDMIFGGAGASGGEGACCGVANLYCQETLAFKNWDNSSYNYTTQTLRAAKNSFSNATQWVACGAGLNRIDCFASHWCDNSGNVGRAAGILKNSCSSTAVVGATAQWGTHTHFGQAGGRGFTGQWVGSGNGWGYCVRTELSDASGTTSWNGNVSVGIPSGMSITSIRA